MTMISDEEKIDLITQANNARVHAYAPYSNYQVGSAVRTKSGRIYTGVNVENAAYPTTMCAERIAIYKAVSDGEREFEAIAVVTPNGGSPCGGCRQVMAEFGLDTIILIGNPAGELLLQATVHELLPGAFIPAHLKY